MRSFYLFLILCLVLLLDGCRGTKTITERVEVPVVVTQEHHTESVKVDHVRDTLIQRDSVYYYVKGDTVRIEKWHYLQGTTNVVRVDTLIKVDSVQVPVEVVRQTTEIKEVNVLKWWQKGLIGIGGISLILLCIFITVKLRK